MYICDMYICGIYIYMIHMFMFIIYCLLIFCTIVEYMELDDGVLLEIGLFVLQTSQIK